jgi:bifunctional non-homologous end joining protein LigD
VALKTYRAKRKFDVTPEPRGAVAADGGNRYVIQKHAARRLHYDLRLELGGVMKSWAVTRGPSLVPGEKRLAIHVEDHPIDYNTFEGTIPQGEYGGGTVMIWDRGSWYPEGNAERDYRKGRLNFRLEGTKLHGGWHLVRMRRREGERQDPWLLIKSDDEAARPPSAPDILEQEPFSVATKRSLDEIKEGKPARKRRPRPSAAGSKPKGAKPTRAAKSKRAKSAAASRKPAKRARSANAVSRVANYAVKRAKPAARRRKPAVKKRAAPANAAEQPVELTHPERIYWDDAGITKQDLVDYYRDVWEYMAPHVTARPLSLLRCPDGTRGQCFFQKHAHATFNQGHILRVRDAGEELIAIDDLEGMIALAQAGVLEVHVWGSTLADIDLCDRLVFDLDPGPGVGLTELIAATKEVRERLAAVKLESFLKTTGGKGFHVVVPLWGADWDAAKDFAHALALAMEADSPERFVSKMTKSRRKGRIFVDYLRNGRGATSVAAYSTRARAGAPVSTPIEWRELTARIAPDKFTLANVRQRLARQRRDPWAGIERIRQKLPRLS